MKHWLLWCLLGCSPLTMADLAVGEMFPDIDVLSQHNKSLHIDDTAQHVFFANTKAASTLMTDFLEARSDAWLAEHHAFYLADIHKMPKVISRMVAMPQMRKLGYDIYLGREAGTFAALSAEDGCVTQISLQQRRVTNVRSLCAIDEFTTAFPL